MSNDGLNNGPSPADNPDSSSQPEGSSPAGSQPGASSPDGSTLGGSRPAGSYSDNSHLELSELDRPSAPTELDYEADPLLRLERNNKSTRQAIWFFVGVIVATTLSAMAKPVTSARPR